MSYPFQLAIRNSVGFQFGVPLIERTFYCKVAGRVCVTFIIIIKSPMKLSLLAVFGLCVLSRAQSLCNGFSSLCDKKYSEVMWSCTHNSYSISTINPPGVAANQLQGYSLTKQWNSGYRCFNVGFRSCDIFNVGPLNSSLTELKLLIDANPTDVVTIYFENSGSPTVSTARLAAALIAAGFKSSYFWAQPAGSTTSDSWPTLSTMISSSSRVVLLTTTTDLTTYPWILSYNDLSAESYYTVTSASGFNCSQFRPASGTRGLFVLNHFRSVSLLAFGTMPDYSDSSTTNSASSINAHISSCTSVGTKVNFLFVDWGNIGDAVLVVATANGVTPVISNNTGPVITSVSSPTSGIKIPFLSDAKQPQSYNWLIVTVITTVGVLFAAVIV
ncbi:hypothetical protein HK096_004583 [Nowakowskiella sp. JEL0078]|nr:hypothetical protein HK096_004583 [Nowakowskiella sp. JEL0078]